MNNIIYNLILGASLILMQSLALRLGIKSAKILKDYFRYLSKS